jgi:hypothetical protein
MNSSCRFYFILPKRASSDCLIYVIKVQAIDPSLDHPNDIIKILNIVFVSVLSSRELSSRKVITVVDFEGFTMGHFGLLLKVKNYFKLLRTAEVCI